MGGKRLSIFVSILGIVAACSGAGPWTLTPIATSPTGTSAFSDAVVANGVVVYVQAGVGSGLKEWSNGTTTTLADKTTPIPGGSGNFSSYSKPAFDGTSVVFLGFDPFTRSGLYKLSNLNGGTFSKIVDSTDPVPGQSGQTFTNFSSFTFSGSLTAFYAQTSIGASAVYSADAGGLHLIAAPGTAGPGFIFNSASGAFASNGGVDFNGTGHTPSNQSAIGLYRSANGQISMVLDNSTAYPGGGQLIVPVNTSINGDSLAGHGQATNAGIIIYKYINGVLYNVADSHHSAPGLTGNLVFTGTAAVGGDSVIFEAGDSNTNGIFTDYGGTLSQLVLDGQSLDGKTVETADITGQAFDGIHAVVTVNFTDNSSAIYLATLPEPSVTMSLGLVILALRRKR